MTARTSRIACFIAHGVNWETEKPSEASSLTKNRVRYAAQAECALIEVKG